MSETKQNNTYVTLEELKTKFKHHINDELCVYKRCSCFYGDVIIIMRKMIGKKKFKTNESRNGIVDRMYAKFRANKLFVLDIIDMKNGSLRDKYMNKYMFKNTFYKVGKKVKPDKFDARLDRICSEGIHFFNCIDAAFYYEFLMPEYTGTWFNWNDNGQLISKLKYENGELSGKKTCWDNSGKLLSKTEYCNGLRHGLHISWYSNRQKSYEGYYDKDIPDGRHASWHENGQQFEEDIYQNGTNIGVSLRWNEKGCITSIRKFNNGKVEIFSRILSDKIEDENKYILLSLSFVDKRQDDKIYTIEEIKKLLGTNHSLKELVIV